MRERSREINVAVRFYNYLKQKEYRCLEEKQL